MAPVNHLQSIHGPSSLQVLLTALGWLDLTLLYRNCRALEAMGFAHYKTERLPRQYALAYRAVDHASLPDKVAQLQSPAAVIAPTLMPMRIAFDSRLHMDKVEQALAREGVAPL